MKEGFPPININIKFGDRRRYYSCFENYHSSKDPKEMVSLVGEYLGEELIRYVEIVRAANEISNNKSTDE